MAERFGLIGSLELRLVLLDQLSELLHLLFHSSTSFFTLSLPLLHFIDTLLEHVDFGVEPVDFNFVAFVDHSPFL